MMMFRNSLILQAGKKIRVVKPPKTSKLSAYTCFVKEANRRPEIAGIATFKERNQVITKLWAGMDDAARQPFVEMSKTSKAVSRSEKAQPLKEGGWKDFVRKNYSKVKNLPFKERLPALKVMWKN